MLSAAPPPVALAFCTRSPPRSALEGCRSGRWGGGTWETLDSHTHGASSSLLDAYNMYITRRVVNLALTSRPRPGADERRLIPSPLLLLTTQKSKRKIHSSTILYKESMYNLHMHVHVYIRYRDQTCVTRSSNNLVDEVCEPAWAVDAAALGGAEQGARRSARTMPSPVRSPPAIQQQD